MTRVLLTILIATVIVLPGHIDAALPSMSMIRHHRGYDDMFDTENSNFTVDWYPEQAIDHSNPDIGTWSQRFAYNDQYYEEGGPVFLFLCGEASMENYYMEVLPFLMAQEHKALYILIEHRFYGKSMPFNDSSTDSLSVLSSQQAIADASQFEKWYKEKHSIESSKWIAFGASYSACLSAWHRTLNPDDVIGAVSPSGPVTAELDMLSYYGQFTYDASSECSSVVKAASAKMLEMLGSDDGLKQLSSIFNSCMPLTSDDAYFFVWLNVGELGSLTQGQLPPTWPLNATCSNLVSAFAKSQSLIDVLEAWSDVISFDNGADDCVDYCEQNYIDSLRETGAGRSWFHQKCSEFGFFHDTAQGSSVFPQTITVERNLEWCNRVFDRPMVPKIGYTNEYYKDLFTKATNVLFTNGKLDPWHNLSVNKPIGGVDAVVYTAGHCAPFHAATPADPNDLIEAREKVRDFVSGLLQ